MELSQNTVDVLNLVLQVGVPILALLLGAALIAVAGSEWVTFYRKWRGHIPGVIEAVNEPTDPAIQLVRHFWPQVAPLLVAHLPRLIRGLQGWLDQWAKIDAPPREVNLSEAGK